MYSKCSKSILLIAVLFLAACSEAPKTATTTKELPSVPVSGKTAFWEMYKPAYSWATDLVPLKLESKQIPGIKNEAGKSAMWSATFYSPSRNQVLKVSYAIAAHSPDIYKGVTVGHPFAWSPNRDAMTFLTGDFSIDSDAAYQTALSQAGTWVKKHPDKEVSLVLGNASRFPSPVWYVLWGEAKTGYSVYVSAKTGATVKPGK